MTLKYMQGFETMRDDSDFRAQGWIASPTKQTMVLAPSLTGVNGTSMRILGPSTANTGTPGASGTVEPGYFNTGITVNQAWLAGGCTFGWWGKFNGGVVASYASSFGGSGYSAGLQMCFDGTRYWALRNVASSVNVYYSTDLINWTVSPAQPGSMNVNSTLQFVAGNVVCVTGTAANTVTYYYSSNQGSSWSTGTASTTGTSSPTFGVAFATGNSSFPLGISCMGYWSSNPSGAAGGMSLNIGTFSTLTSVYSSSNTGASSYTGTTKVYNGIIFHLQTGNAGCKLQQATQSNASLNTAGAWTQSAIGANAADMVYSSVSNLFVFATLAGISTTPNTNGTAGNPAVLPATPTLTSRYSTAGMTNIFVVGTTLVAVGLQGHIITSVDGGITWVESGGHILPVGTSGINWMGAFYDGAQYVLFSDTTTGVIATSTDLQSNYAVKYVMEPTEQSAAVNGNGHTGIYSGTAPNSSTGLWTFSGGYVAAAVTALSAGARGLAIVSAASGRETTINIPSASTQLTHYYELVCVPAAGANNFTHNVYIDGLLVYQGSTVVNLGTGTGDTTSLLILTLEKFATITAFDDMYFCLNDGSGLSGPQGIINIVVQRPTTDVQAQWVKNGGAASNALSVNQPALSSQAANFVSSANAGDKDIYSTTDALPSGFTPKAVQNEAYFTKTSTSAPGVSIGLISGSTEVDSATVNITGSGATYVSQIVEKDPNGNVAWTTSSVNAAKFVDTHSS